MFELTPLEIEATLLSLKVASVATLAALPLAVLAGYALSKDFPGHAAVNAATHLPLVLPPVVTGYALLALFGRHGALGAFLADHLGIVFAFRWTGAALAAATMSFPLLVRPVRLSFEAVDPRLPRAARSLGANALWAFLLVELPLALPGVLAGAALGFAKALGEFGATITFVSSIPGETRTIPAAIYGLLQAPEGEAGALRLSLLATALAVAALLLSEELQRRAGRRA